MRFALMIEPQQGLSYGDQVAIAKRAEANGFDTLFRSDHYQSFPGPGGRPTTDAWAVLAGLARDTQRIGLGALVSPMTFRHPGNFAKVVTTVDEMSGGRIEVGVGAGWNEVEHRQLGLSFPPITERADLLEDTLAILHGLWGEPDGWSYTGHTVSRSTVRTSIRSRSTCRAGRARRSAARDRGSSSAAVARHARTALPRATPTSSTSTRGVPTTRARPTPRSTPPAGRSGAIRPRWPDRPWSASWSVVPTAEMSARVAAVTEAFGTDADDAAWLEERATRWVTGTPDHARAAVRRYEAAGVQRLVLQDFLPWDLDMIDVMGEALISGS